MPWLIVYSTSWFSAKVMRISPSSLSSPFIVLLLLPDKSSKVFPKLLIFGVHLFSGLKLVLPFTLILEKECMCLCISKHIMYLFPCQIKLYQCWDVLLKKPQKTKTKAVPFSFHSLPPPNPWSLLQEARAAPSAAAAPAGSHKPVTLYASPRNIGGMEGMSQAAFVCLPVHSRALCREHGKSGIGAAGGTEQQGKAAAQGQQSPEEQSQAGVAGAGMWMGEESVYIFTQRDLATHFCCSALRHALGNQCPQRMTPLD